MLWIALLLAAPAMLDLDIPAVDAPVVDAGIKAEVDAAVDAEAQTGPTGAGLIVETQEPAAARPRTAEPTEAAEVAETVGLVGLLLALLAGPVGWIVRRLPLAWCGFSRLSRSDLLDQPVRRDIMETIRSRPGVTISEVVDMNGVAWGTAVYHLRRLEREGLVVSEREGRDRRHWDIQSPEARSRKATKVLRSRSPRQVARLVCSHPGLNQSDIRQRVGLSVGAASQNLKRLEQAGFVKRETRGGVGHYVPTPALEQALPA